MHLPKSIYLYHFTYLLSFDCDVIESGSITLLLAEMNETNQSLSPPIHLDRPALLGNVTQSAFRQLRKSNHLPHPSFIDASLTFISPFLCATLHFPLQAKRKEGLGSLHTQHSHLLYTQPNDIPCSSCTYTLDIRAG